MGHALVVDMPEEIYASLSKTAEDIGYSPEELAMAWLRAKVHDVADDPLEAFIGLLDTGIVMDPNDHNRYFGENLEAETSGEEREERRAS